MIWVSVKDILPEPGVDCLTFTPDIEGRKYRIFATNNGKFFSGVTHWMPLPESPKESSREKGPLILAANSGTYPGIEPKSYNVTRGSD